MFRVTRDRIVFGFAGTTASSSSLSPVADLERSFPRLLGLRLAGSGRAVPGVSTLANKDLGATILNWDGSDFDLARNTAAEAIDHQYDYEVLEDQTPTAYRDIHGFRVRSFDIIRFPAGTTSLNSSVTGVTDPNRVAVIPCAYRGASTGQEWGDCNVRLGWSGDVNGDRGSSINFTTTTFAAVEFGSAWTVRQLTMSSSIRGADVTIPGAGLEPWNQKLYFYTYQTPATAHNLADNPLVRTGNNANELQFQLPSNATAGTYTLTAFVLHHPLLEVVHWNSVDLGFPDIGVNSTEETIAIPGGVPDPSSSSIIVHGDGEGANTLYPRAHWGYTIDGNDLYMRRGRTAPRGSRWAAQLVRWFTVPQGGAGGALGRGSVAAFSGSGARPTVTGGSSSPSSVGLASTPAVVGAGRG